MVLWRLHCEWRRVCRLMLVAALALQVTWACAGDRSRVCMARAERILMPESVLAPPFIYPEGKIDYDVVAGLLDTTMMDLSGRSNPRDAWLAYFKPLDRVGIQLDVEPLMVHQAILDAITLHLMSCGIPQDHIIIYSGQEGALFRAGFDLRRDGGRAQVMGADAEGYRKGLSRIVLDYCTAIINLTRLRVDPRVGMWGAIANCTAAVPYVQREEYMRQPELLPSAAARASLKLKTRLHIMDALRPGWIGTDDDGRMQTWQYRGVLVSEDPVALDTIGHGILLDQLRETDPEATQLSPPVKYLQPAAERYRLGVADPEAIDLSAVGP